MTIRTYIVTLTAGVVIVFGTPAAAAQSGEPEATTPAPTTTQPSQTITGPTPQPQPTPGPTPTAPQPSPQPMATQTTPSLSPGSNCSLTSNGLVCVGATTSCFVTSTGVTCPLNCSLTSAGVSCPQGGVAAGEVLGEGPTAGGQEKKTTKRRAKQKPSGERNGLEPVVFARRTGARELPFTGWAMAPSLVLGLALMTAGLVLRRRTAPLAEGAESVGGGVQTAPAAVDLPPPRPPGILVRALVLVACGALLRARSRHWVA